MQSAPEIPPRVSSKKRHASPSLEQQEAKKKQLTKYINSAKDGLKPRESYDASFWDNRASISRLLQKKTNLSRKISMKNFQSELTDPEEKAKAWVLTTEGREFAETMRAHKLDQKLCERQARRLDNSNHENSDFLEKNRRRAYMKLFGSSFRGLAIDHRRSGGKREGGIQYQFKNCLILAQKNRHPNYPDNTELWCPILGAYHPSAAMKAAHIFPWCNGQEMMTKIFGIDAGLNSIFNGIMMCTPAEERFDKGHFVIVPAIKDSDSLAEIAHWNQTDPKSYKIRIIDAKAKGMNELVNGEGSKRWFELDGKEVSFKGDARPRARYLYYHYCVTMLRRSWNLEKKERALKDELGKPFWATPGRYMRERMLGALVEEMGHEYEGLLAGAFEEEGSSDTLLCAATQQIQMSNGGKDEVSAELDDSNEEYEEAYDSDETWYE